MSHGKFGLKALGLCLVAALGIMAFVAVSAQAATWLEAGAVIKTTLKVIGKPDPKAPKIDWTLDTTAPVIGGVLEILCNELVIKDGLLFADGTGLAELEFKGDCLSFVNKVKQEACAPKEPIVAKVKIEQYTHAGELYYLFSPDNATLVFTTLVFSPECAFGEKVEVKGHAIVKDCEKLGLVDKVTHLIEQVEGKGFDLTTPTVHQNSLAFGKNVATLLGSELLELETKSTWAGHV